MVSTRKKQLSYLTTVLTIAFVVFVGVPAGLAADDGQSEESSSIEQVLCGVDFPESSDWPGGWSEHTHRNRGRHGRGGRHGHGHHGEGHGHGNSDDDSAWATAEDDESPRPNPDCEAPATAVSTYHPTPSHILVSGNGTNGATGCKEILPSQWGSSAYPKEAYNPAILYRPQSGTPFLSCDVPAKYAPANYTFTGRIVDSLGNTGIGDGVIYPEAVES
jgi:hypothetical protein